MSVVSSMPTIAPEPSIDPSLSTTVFSRGISRCSSKNQGAEAPPGINAFIELAKNLEQPLLMNHLELTHPPLVVRARALIWFSMTKIVDSPFENQSNFTNDKNKLDSRVSDDLQKYGCCNYGGSKAFP